MSTETDLRAKRATLVNEARDVMKRSEDEKRSITADEQAQVDRIMEEVDNLKAKIDTEDRSNRVNSALKELDEVRTKSNRLNPNGSKSTAKNDGDEYRAAFDTYIRTASDAEVRSLLGGATTGLTLLPLSMESVMVDTLADFNVMRGVSTVQTFDSDRDIPTVTSHGAAAWTTAGSSYNESDDAFTEKTIKSYKMTRLIKVSEELLADNAVNLENYLGQSFGRSFGELEEAAFISGDGSGKPTGFIQDADTGATVAASGTFGAGEIVTAFHSLKPQYRNRATWLFADETIAEIRALREGTGDAAGGADRGNFIWQPGLQAGQPDTILGRPVVVAAQMSDIDVGTTFGAFGDFSYYLIADRVGVGFTRMNERYGDEGLVGFRAARRTDGLLTLAEAIKLIKNPSP